MAKEESGWSIRRIAKELIIGLLILFVVSQAVNYIRKPKISYESIPVITARMLDGSLFEVKRGEPLIIHFWGSWCPICKMEASNIEHVSEKYNVLSIAVKSGDNKDIEGYMKEHQLHFKVLNDKNGEWAKRFNVEVFPTTFIYDGDGNLRFTEVGYTTTAGLLARLGML